MGTIEDISALGIDYMIERGYSADTVERHEREWRKIAAYAKSVGIEGLTERLKAEYIELVMTKERAWSTKREAIRRVDHLFDFASTGRFKGQVVLNPFKADEAHERAIEDYVESLKRRGLSRNTTISRRRAARRFLSLACKGARLEDLRQSDIANYLGSLAEGWTSRSVSTTRGALKDFFAFLSKRIEFGEDPMPFFEAKSATTKPLIPTVYSADELMAILDAAKLNSKNPKRDHLLVLIAIRYGLRKSDILGIKFSDLDPENETLFVSQQKTGKTNMLPLTDEMMVAIADYVKNERPESSEPYIFLNGNPPFRPCIESNEGALSYILRRSMFLAGIDPAGRKSGAHSIRRSLATTMMNEGVSYPVISNVLGHTNSEKSISDVTMAYIAIDVERMRKLSLEVPE